MTVSSDLALTNDDVDRLTKAGVGTSVIIAKIETSRMDFDKSNDQLTVPAQGGVDGGVIGLMV